MVLGKLPLPGRLAYLNYSRIRAFALEVGAGGGCLDIFSLSSIFSQLLRPDGKLKQLTHAMSRYH